VSGNDTTLQSYNEHVAEYIAGTPQTVDGDFKAWIDGALALTPAEGVILEIGSANGRDAAYIKQKGYRIIATDAATNFVNLLKEAGLETQQLNVLSEELGRNYDLVFANGVLLHFVVDEFRLIIRKVHSSLKEGGIFAFSVQQGAGSEWRDNKLGAPRFFQYWDKQSLKNELDSAGFGVLELTPNDSGKWLHVIAKR